MKNIINSICLALILFHAPAQAAEDTFYTLDGKPVKIESYLAKNKWTVVMIWASDCQVCNKEAPAYVNFHEKHKHKDAILLGLSMDGLKNIQYAKAFIRDHRVSFQNLIADPETVAGFYNEQTGDTWYGTPTFLIYSPQGKLKAAQSGAVPPAVIEDYINKNSK